MRPAAGRLVFSFVDQAVQAAIRGQGVALVRSPFLQDGVASGDLVMPFPALRMPAGYRHVLVLNPEAARRPPVEVFAAWLREQFAQAPQLGACARMAAGPSSPCSAVFGFLGLSPVTALVHRVGGVHAISKALIPERVSVEVAL